MLVTGSHTTLADAQIAGRTSGHPIGRTAGRKAGIPLWIVQVLLSLLFLFAGVMKLVAPAELMVMPVPLPIAFLRFVGACESLGALGLILPGLTRIRPGLTPLAAALLVPIMVGATAVTLLGGDIASALVPVVVGVLAASVAYGRWRLAPHRSRSYGRLTLHRGSWQPSALQAAA